MMRPLLPLPVLAMVATAFCADPVAHPEPVEKLGDGRLRIGLVIVDPEARTATFPAKVNMAEGHVEYMIVNEGGKTHESALSTQAQPINIHAAMLLLGAKGSPESRGEKPTDPEGRQPIDAESLAGAKVPGGEEITVSLAWKQGGEDRNSPLEDWVINEKQGARAKRGPWIYNGSELYAGRFVAQGDGSIVAVITDSFALINNPREGSNDDLIWLIDTKAIPPVDTPVTVTIFADKKTRESTSSKTSKE